MIDHWKGFREAIKDRYGHWPSSERSRMLELIKAAERVIESDRNASPNWMWETTKPNDTNERVEK